MNNLLNLLTRLVLTFVKTRGGRNVVLADSANSQPVKSRNRKIRFVKKQDKIPLKSLRKVRYYELHDEVISIDIDNYISDFSDTLDYQYSLYTRKIKSLLHQLCYRLSKKYSIGIKRWNAALHDAITLLFGLSNAHPSYIFSAIFGSSSFRIQA